VKKRKVLSRAAKAARERRLILKRFEAMRQRVRAMDAIMGVVSGKVSNLEGRVTSHDRWISGMWDDFKRREPELAKNWQVYGQPQGSVDAPQSAWSNVPDQNQIAITRPASTYSKTLEEIVAKRTAEDCDRIMKRWYVYDTPKPTKAARGKAGSGEKTSK
jgi:hypothetical protein